MDYYAHNIPKQYK